MLSLLAATFVVCLVTEPVSTQSPTRVPRGQLVENVPSETVSGQRYTVYLPSSYDPAHPAPVLYLMEPRGRARLAGRLFQPAAERYGYILISSHNTASDISADVVLQALQAMWDDSHRWFTLDERRVYLAGFSGTARVATLLAHNRPHAITGVIGAAAGFHPSLKPSSDSRFLYFGTVGDSDYNFHEIETLEQSLLASDRPHRIQRFSGPHSWMPAGLALAAIEWFELRAMQAGTRPRDDGLIDAWWSRDSDEAERASVEQRHLDAARRYAAMARDYAGLRDTTGVKEAAARITGSAARAELRQRQASARQAKEWISHSMQVISNAYPVGASVPLRGAGDLAEVLEIGRMKKAAAAATKEGLEAQRRLNELEVQLGFYLPQDAMEASDAGRASYYVAVALQVSDRSPVTWYVSARASALLNSRRDAVTALHRAVDAGFRDLALLGADPAFRRLRGERDFLAISERLKAAGDPMETLTVDRPPMPPLPLR